MTIVKHETLELTREEFTTIKKCIKLMTTARNGAKDPVLNEEAHKIALALIKFRDNFTVHVSKNEEETLSDYDRGFQDGVQWEHDNPSIRPNY